MLRVIKFTCWTLGSCVLLVVAIALYLQASGLSDYRNTLSGYLTEKTGRQVTIDGPIEVHFGPLLDLVADQVQISSTNWPSHPSLLGIEHLSLTINLWSLIQGPLVIEDLAVDGVEVYLAIDADSRANWQSAEVAGEIQPNNSLDLVAFKNVKITNLQLQFEDPGHPGRINLSLEHLTVTPDPGGILRLDVNGMVNRLPLQIDGTVGPWQNIAADRNIAADVTLTLGNLVHFKLEGSVDEALTLSGMDLNLDASGKSFEQITSTFSLPPVAQGAFQVKASIASVNSTNTVQLKGNLGAIELLVTGESDKLLKPEHSHLAIQVSGPDARRIAEALGIKGLPTEAFDLAAEVTQDAHRIQVTRSQASIGDNVLHADGWLDLSQSSPNTDMVVSATGPDFSIVGPFLGIKGIPQEPYQVNGQFRKLGSSWRFDSIEGDIGENRIEANGSLDWARRSDTQISFTVFGPDNRFIQAMIGLGPLPPKPYRISAIIRSDPAGLLIKDAKAQFGDNEIGVDGIVSNRKGFEGTNLQVRISGMDLTNVALFSGFQPLPEGPYSGSANFGIESSLIHLESGQISAGGMELATSGTIGFGSRLKENELDVNLSGQDIAQLKAVELFQKLEGKPFRLAGHMSQASELLNLHDVRATVGNLDLSLEGSFDIAAGNSKLAFDATAPDSSIFSRLTTLDKQPRGTLSASGTIESSKTHLNFTKAQMRIGAISLNADGLLSTSPLANNSDLEFSVSGPDLKQFALPFGFEKLPAKTFNVSGKFSGTPTGFAIENLIAYVGENEIRARFSADLRDRPIVSGTLSSTYLDLTDQIAPADGQPDNQEQVKGKLVFSTEPLDLTWLSLMDLKLSTRIGQLMTNRGNFDNFDLNINLNNGTLQIEPITLSQSGGKLTARFLLEPKQAGHSVYAQLNAENLRVRIMSSPEQDQTTLPPFSGNIDFSGFGSSFHEFLMSSNGNVSIYQGQGKISTLTGGRIVGDLLTQVLDIFNPLKKKETHTKLECGIFVIGIKNGIAKIDTAAIQTDKVKVVSTGKIDFSTEALDLSLRATPRKGLGISITSVSNSFLKLGGTLKAPSLNIDPASSITSTGAAWATGGLSILARGLWDRALAEESICSAPEFSQPRQ